MTIMVEHMKLYRERFGRVRRDSWGHIELEWPQELPYGSTYGIEEELFDQREKLPSSDEVEELCSLLRVAALREFSSEVVNGSIDHLKQRIDQLEYIRLLNSWIATAEETLAAGKNVKRIAARRKK